MFADNDDLLDSIGATLPPILEALDALTHVARHLHPANLAERVDATTETAKAVREHLDRFRAVSFPVYLENFQERIESAGQHVCHAFAGLAAAAGQADGIKRARRELNHRNRAIEALYPLAAVFPSVNRFFVEPERREDADLSARLARSDFTREDVGVIHRDNAREKRGGCSLYVPEYYDSTVSYPLIVALHGGSGHGRDFLWNWIVEARTRGAIVLSPSSKDRTWSLMGRDIDSPNIEQMVEQVGEQWHIDERKRLLTGMSDGGTFCYISGLRQSSPFTHWAPCSATFHPTLLAACPKERLADLPIYLLHGALDWMFPVEVAQTANESLRAAGAAVEYREIADLSHAWPHDENPRIMDWFLGAAGSGEETASAAPTRPTS